MIPVQVGGVGGIGVLAQEAQGERRLADLARTADEDHFSLQCVGDAALQIAGDMHGMDYSPLYS